MTTRFVYPYYNTTLGCDPEFFFAQQGEVIGAEKVLEGKKIEFRKYGTISAPNAGFVIDGVQVELNPSPNTCRANLGNEIAAAFRSLKVELAKLDKVSANFTTVVEVSRQELDSLSERAKLLGCAPSLNAYDSKATITVDPTVYRKRSAGGHIHLGLEPMVRKNAANLVPLLDTMLGNTCVMIDRDPHAAERRQNYGRAGEHRLPPHGLEYRTLSNFWLRAYPLMSMVMGLSRQAVSIFSHGEYMKDPVYKRSLVPANTTTLYYDWNPYDHLMAQVDLDKVRTAINTNDPVLARETWGIVRDFCAASFAPSDYHSLGPANAKAFDEFLTIVQEKGIETYWPGDPLDHWCNLPDGHGRGWESFLERTFNVKGW